MRRRAVLVGLLSAALGLGVGGCAATVSTGAYYSPPSLVWLGPGIWVVEDYRYPVFYADGYYWRWYGGVWYRAATFGRSWVRVGPRYVPPRVRRIDNPRRYVRYRAPRGARVRQGPPPRQRVDRRGAPRHKAAPRRQAPGRRVSPPRRDAPSERRVAPPSRGGRGGSPGRQAPSRGRGGGRGR
ncbi:MAG: hypothetical protein ACODAU_01990 [Myxococcota bacterium]